MVGRIPSAVVTGATGFIGSALVQRLSREGASVTCLVRSQSRGRDGIAGLPGVQLAETSFEAADLAKKLPKAEVVFNLASAGVSPEERDPEALLSGNVNVIMSLIQAAAECGIHKLVHTGSCAEYGPIPERRPLTEDDPIHPLSLYGAAKACAHLYGRTLALSRNVEFMTLRLFGVFGPGESSYRLLPYLISRLRENRPVDLTGGEQVRDFLYIDDVVEALIQSAGRTGEAHGGAFNVCSGTGTTVRDMALKAAALMNKPASLLHFGHRPYRPDEPMYLAGDNRRFAALTGWSPRVSIGEGLGNMVQALAEK